MKDPSVSVPPIRVGALIRVRPAAAQALPWMGVLIDSAQSPMGGTLAGDSSGHYQIVQCVDACGAVGMRVGEHYLVRASFIEGL